MSRVTLVTPVWSSGDTGEPPETLPAGATLPAARTAACSAPAPRAANLAGVIVALKRNLEFVQLLLEGNASSLVSDALGEMERDVERLEELMIVEDDVPRTTPRRVTVEIVPPISSTGDRRTVPVPGHR